MVCIVIAVERDAELKQVIRAVSSPSRLSRHLHRGQKQANQYDDDRKDHQQLDGGKRSMQRMTLEDSHRMHP
jgi:hypothetical protein